MLGGRLVGDTGAGACKGSAMPGAKKGLPKGPGKVAAPGVLGRGAPGCSAPPAVGAGPGAGRLGTVSLGPVYVPPVCSGKGNGVSLTSTAFWAAVPWDKRSRIEKDANK